MEGIPIVRDRKRPRKIIDETIKKDLDFDDLIVDMTYNRTLWRCLIHVANPT